MYSKLEHIPILGAPLAAVAGFSETVSPHHPPLGEVAVALLAGMIGAVCACVGFWVRGWQEKNRPGLARDQTPRDQSSHFHGALLNNSRQALVILGTDINFGNGNMLLQQCTTGPDAEKLAHAFDDLLKTGKSFELSARAAEGGVIALRGTPIGHRAVVYLEEKRVAEIAAAEAELRLTTQAHADLLERLSWGVAVFDASQRLTGYNSHYAQFWGLSDAWLDAQPSFGEILSRLRDSRKLPEQRDFSTWQQRQLGVFAKAGHKTAEVWHLPGGKSVSITTQPHLQGGIFVLFEDISERLRLETSLNLITQVQKATLDTLDEGIAIFGTDGCLVLHNAHFAQLWRLTESELSTQPHFADIAHICNERIGQDSIWSVVAAGVSSMEPERRGKWGKARRADGRIISLSLSRLPNGATIVTFFDLTDLERFEDMQRETLLEQASAGVKVSRKT